MRPTNRSTKRCGGSWPRPPHVIDWRDRLTAAAFGRASKALGAFNNPRGGAWKAFVLQATWRPAGTGSGPRGSIPGRRGLDRGCRLVHSPPVRGAWLNECGADGAPRLVQTLAVDAASSAPGVEGVKTISSTGRPSAARRPAADRSMQAHTDHAHTISTSHRWSAPGLADSGGRRARGDQQCQGGGRARTQQRSL